MTKPATADRPPRREAANHRRVVDLPIVSAAAAPPARGRATLASGLAPEGQIVRTTAQCSANDSVALRGSLNGCLRALADKRPGARVKPLPASPAPTENVAQAGQGDRR